MFKKIKQSLAIVASLSILAFAMLAPVNVHALACSAAGANPDACDSDIRTNLCSGANLSATTDENACTTIDATGETGATGSFNKLLKNVINIFSLVVGIVAVLMIIYAGFKYITSGGNDGNVGTAKNTILYAVIGLVVVALAQVIVRFVLTKAKV